MVGIYCRISKHKQKGKDVSIEVQKQNGIDFAKKIGEGFEVFVDEGISGQKNEIEDRPQFAMLLDGVKNKVITKVYCNDQSRIERNTKIWNLFCYILNEANCEYYEMGRLIDLRDPQNILITGIMSLINSFQAITSGLKAKKSIRVNALKGKTHGLTAYGYTKDDGGYFKIDEKEAVIVKCIYQMSLEGIGTYTIANKLNAEGIPTRFNRFKGQISRIDKYTKNITTYDKKAVVWRGNVIFDIIKNPIYKGLRKWNEDIVKVPAIIDEEYWLKVNNNLEKNKKKVGKREEYSYLLNGITYCGKCGSEYKGKKRLKGNDNAYKCKGKSSHKITCINRGISLPKLETFIINHLFLSKDLQIYLTSLEENKAETDNLKTKLTKLKKEYNKNITAEKLAYDRLLDPDFADDFTIKDRLKAIKKKLKEQEENIILLENMLIERDGNRRVKRYTNLLGQFSLNSSFDDTKRLVHSLIKKITIEHNYKENANGGYYLVKIEYRGYDETSMFMTDWKALKWYWLTHYRKEAINDEDMANDKELLKYFSKSQEYTDKIPSNFKGFETYSGVFQMIELKKDELVNFY